MFFLVTDILFPKRSRDFHWAQNVNSRKIIKRNAWLFYPLTTAYFPRAAKGKGEPGILPYVHKLDTVRRWIDVDLFRNFRSIDEVYRSIWGLGCNEYLKKFKNPILEFHPIDSFSESYMEFYNDLLS